MCTRPIPEIIRPNVLCNASISCCLIPYLSVVWKAEYVQSINYVLVSTGQTFSTGSMLSNTEVWSGATPVKFTNLPAINGIDTTPYKHARPVILGVDENDKVMTINQTGKIKRITREQFAEYSLDAILMPICERTMRGTTILEPKLGVKIPTLKFVPISDNYVSRILNKLADYTDRCTIAGLSLESAIERAGILTTAIFKEMPDILNYDLYKLFRKIWELYKTSAYPLPVTPELQFAYQPTNKPNAVQLVNYKTITPAYNHNLTYFAKFGKCNANQSKRALFGYIADSDIWGITADNGPLLELEFEPGLHLHAYNFQIVGIKAEKIDMSKVIVDTEPFNTASPFISVVYCEELKELSLPHFTTQRKGCKIAVDDELRSIKGLSNYQIVTLESLPKLKAIDLRGVSGRDCWLLSSVKECESVETVLLPKDLELAKEITRDLINEKALNPKWRYEITLNKSVCRMDAVKKEGKYDRCN